MKLGRRLVCVVCRDRTPIGWLPKVGGTCAECAVAAFIDGTCPPAALIERSVPLCVACRYWAATVGPLCDACAGAPLTQQPPPAERTDD